MSDDEFLKAEPHEEPWSQAKGVNREVAQEWEPKPRYTKFWTMAEDKREGLERHEMSIAEDQCWRARKFGKRTGAFGKGLNLP